MNIAPESCIGLVLAGGRSSRMGRDKRHLRWKDETLLDRSIRHVAETLQIDAEEVWISGEVSRPRAILDREPGRGPVEGVRSAFLRFFPPKAESGAVGRMLILPVDQPLMTSETLSLLWGASLVGEAAVHLFQGSELPAVLRLDERTGLALGEVAGQAGRERSFKALWEKLGAVEIPVTEAIRRALTNVNFPDEWRSIAPEEVRP